MNGTFERYPELKCVFLETGVAWTEWWFRRVDQQYREVRTEVPWVKRLPSDHFRDNIWLATQPLNDMSPREFTDMVDATRTHDVYVFATDYPHYDADSAEAILPRTIPAELRDKVRFRNAVDTYPKLAGLERAA
jgi:predicted TIM-barrel fold metal-dependent hydrolase